MFAPGFLSSHLPLSPRLGQMSLNCEYISFRTQGDGMHWDFALRTPALQSLEAPAVEGPRPPISPSVGLIPAADKEGSSWASGQLPSGSQLVNICCVTGEGDRTACGLLYEDHRYSKLNSLKFRKRLLMPFTLLHPPRSSPGSSATPPLPDLQNQNAPIRSSRAEPTSNICVWSPRQCLQFHATNQCPTESILFEGSSAKPLALGPEFLFRVSGYGSVTGAQYLPRPNRREDVPWEPSLLNQHTYTLSQERPPCA